LTAVLEAIEKLEVVEVESETLDCKLTGVTATRGSVPFWVAVLVERTTTPAVDVEA
jgi:hypothetical protein